jgi:ABC-type multidrug transport system fused ATPase/permease subunit
MKLIAGYLHPDSGSISILGNTLSKTALKTYYPHIGYLTQEPGVFDATIRENLISAIAEKTNTYTNTMENGIVSETKNKNTTVYVSSVCMPR